MSVDPPAIDALIALRDAMRDFAAEREWEVFHTPKNLAMALAGEAGEVIEHFQWLTAEQSAALPPDTRGEVAFELADVLDMGEQIKLTELARDLIRLSGHLPDVDIPIRFVGLRPGEKLYEELVGYDENAEQSVIEKIRCVRTPKIVTAAELSARVAMLHHLAIIQDTRGVIEGLRQLVPTFEPTGTNCQYVACSPGSQTYDVSEPELPPTKLGVEL